MDATYERFLNEQFKDKLPLKYDDKNKEFYEYIVEYLQNYQDRVNNLGILSNRQSFNLHNLILGIFDALEQYYKGQPSRAYNALEGGLKYISSYLRILSDSTVNDQNLFRIRVSNNADSHTFDYKEMFHIPFNKRHLVSSQRFSIPGLPAIYLGSSLYVCWEELGRPNFKNIKASLFKYHKTSAHKIINLGISHRELKAAIENHKTLGAATNKLDARSIFAAYCIVWPLIAACSVKVKEKGASFKPEYIIPQLLSQYVASDKRDTEEDFIGIVYLSASGAYYNENNQELFCNYFFPVQEKQLEGYCLQLRNTFKLTKGIPWQLFEIYNSAAEDNLYTIDTIYADHKSDLQLIFDEVGNNIQIPYKRTDFGKFETFLEQKIKVNSLDFTKTANVTNMARRANPKVQK
ncbi:hypothetical protein C1N61_29860 (plasmid) [Priestia aryabhattai]